MDEDPGGKFWLKLIGGIVLGGIVVFLFGVFFLRAIYAWGILGTTIALAALALLVGWIFDKRNARHQTSDF